MGVLPLVVVIPWPAATDSPRAVVVANVWAVAAAAISSASCVIVPSRRQASVDWEPSWGSTALVVPVAETPRPIMPPVITRFAAMPAAVDLAVAWACVVAAAASWVVAVAACYMATRPAAIRAVTQVAMLDAMLSQAGKTAVAAPRLAMEPALPEPVMAAAAMEIVMDPAMAACWVEAIGSPDKVAWAMAASWVTVDC